MSINKDKDFKTIGLVANGSIEVDVIDYNGSMAVLTDEMPIIINRQQAMDFFGLTEDQP